MKILPLNKFRRLKEFSKFFPINNDTVIAYDNCIYSNKELYPDVLIHELEHIRQQKEYGLNAFTKKYLNNKKFRLEMEKQAYIKQINSIKDKGLQEAVTKDIIIALQSGLYGKVSDKQAKELLGIKESKLNVNRLI